MGAGFGCEPVLIASCFGGDRYALPLRMDLVVLGLGSLDHFDGAVVIKT